MLNKSFVVGMKRKLFRALGVGEHEAIVVCWKSNKKCHNCEEKVHEKWSEKSLWKVNEFLKVKESLYN